MDRTGPLSGRDKSALAENEAKQRVVDAPASTTPPRPLNGRNSSGLVYRTPADVRAIPNAQIEQWIRDDSLPGPRFSSERRCQQVLALVVDSAKHRLGIRTHGVKVTL